MNSLLSTYTDAVSFGIITEGVQELQKKLQNSEPIQESNSGFNP